jgi:hypothetical protein
MRHDRATSVHVHGTQGTTANSTHSGSSRSESNGASTSSDSRVTTHPAEHMTARLGLCGISQRLHADDACVCRRALRASRGQPCLHHGLSATQLYSAELCAKKRVVMDSRFCQKLSPFWTHGADLSPDRSKQLFVTLCPTPRAQFHDGGRRPQ